MTAHGWSEGQSLGRSVRGIVDALDAEGGQKPTDKRGFGYELVPCLSFVYFRSTAINMDLGTNYCLVYLSVLICNSLKHMPLAGVVDCDWTIHLLGLFAMSKGT